MKALCFYLEKKIKFEKIFGNFKIKFWEFEIHDLRKYQKAEKLFHDNYATFVAFLFIKRKASVII